MNNDFESAYQKGLLSKKLFLESKTTKEFISWLVPFIKGEKDLRQIDYKYCSFIEAINDYGYNKESFNETYKMFEDYRNAYSTLTEEKLKDECIKILKWGGVMPRNKKKIELKAKMGQLKEFLSNIYKIINSDEIIIDDLNTNFINSGFTKIYTAFYENFTMYDGRVGSALCYLIKNYLIEKNDNKLPIELIFGWGQGRSDNFKRNPNIGSILFKFPEITQNRTIHFVGNIKTNWLLKKISEITELVEYKDEQEKIFALQTALFVLGEKIP